MNELIKQMIAKLTSLELDLNTLSEQVTDEQWEEFQFESIQGTFDLSKGNLQGLLEEVEEAQKEGGDCHEH